MEGHGYFLNPSRSSAQETKVQEANIHQVNRSCLVDIFELKTRRLILYNYIRTNDLYALYAPYVLVYGPVS